MGALDCRNPGYDAFYSFSRSRNGYSGVVTFVKSAGLPTLAAEEGLAGLFKTEDAVGHVGDAHTEVNNSSTNNTNVNSVHSP